MPIPLTEAPCRQYDPLRSRIAMYLHGTAGSPAERTLLEEANRALAQLQILVDHWRRAAHKADALRVAEIDDGKFGIRARQEGGDHYLNMGIQPWDAMRAWLSPEQFSGYLLGSAINYAARFNAKAAGKGGLPDLLKARHCLDQLIALESRE